MAMAMRNWETGTSTSTDETQSTYLDDRKIQKGKNVQPTSCAKTGA